MKNLVWILFIPGFLCNPNPLKINPDSLVTWKGSCVVIPCQINRYNGALLRDISLHWYFQPFYDTNHSDYSANILYEISAKSRKCSTPSLSAFAGRLKFVGNVQNNLEKKICSLKISQARTEDSGIYEARLSASYLRPVQRSTWFFNATVNVTESPPVPKMDISPGDIREGWTRVTCSVPYHCPEEPLRLPIRGLGGTRLSSQRMTISSGVIQTVVNLQMTWEDHRKSLVCSLRRWNGLEISKSTMQLDVKYAPKDVRVIASPGTIIREGEAFSLECRINSSNPEVYEYLWYKDDQLMYEQLKKIEFKTEGDWHSGAYRCEANNGVGSEKSEELSIDVQYAPRDVQLIASTAMTIREGEIVSLECTLNSSNPEFSEYLWYKDDQAVDEWKNHKTIEFEIDGDQRSGTYRCEAKNSAGTQKSEELIIEYQSHLRYGLGPSASGPEATTQSEGTQSSPLLPSTPEGVSSLLPSTSYPPSLSELPPSGVPIPPLPSSQASFDSRTLLEEFSFLSESLDQVVKAQNQFIHSSQELTSAVVQLTQKLQEALLQKRQKTRVVPSEIKKQ